VDRSTTQQQTQKLYFHLYAAMKNGQKMLAFLHLAIAFLHDLTTKRGCGNYVYYTVAMLLLTRTLLQLKLVGIQMINLFLT
jgi:hypothetical protein